MQSKCVWYIFVSVFWLSPLHLFIDVTKICSKHYKALLHPNSTSECFQMYSSHSSTNLHNSTLPVCQTINSSLIYIICFYILHLILYFICETFSEKIKRRAKTCSNKCLIVPLSIYTQVSSQQPTASSMVCTFAARLLRICFHSSFIFACSPYIPGIYVNSSQPAILILKSVPGFATDSSKITVFIVTL